MSVASEVVTEVLTVIAELYYFSYLGVLGSAR
jgi:hypothetical protein